MIAIDKPSDILLRFLSKHYQLKDPLWQSNNFVVFRGFFNQGKNQISETKFSNLESPSNVKVAHENAPDETDAAPLNVEIQSETIPVHLMGDAKQQVDSYNNVSKGRLMKSLGHHKLW